MASSRTRADDETPIIVIDTTPPQTDSRESAVDGNQLFTEAELFAFAQSPNQASDFWEESPTSKGLLQERTRLDNADRPEMLASNPVQRPTSVGSISQPINFSFKPVHTHRSANLGRPQPLDLKHHVADEMADPLERDHAPLMKHPKSMPDRHKKSYLGNDEPLKPSTGVQERSKGISEAQEPTDHVQAESIDDDSNNVEYCEAKSAAANHDLAPQQQRAVLGALSCASEHPAEHDGDGAGSTTAGVVYRGPQQSEVHLYVNDGLGTDAETNVVYVTRSPPTCEGTETIAPLPKTPTGRLIHSSRVTKTPPRQTHYQPNSEASSHKISSPRQEPSEEDLLFLLMARARQSSTDIKRLSRVEHQNRQLRREISQTRLRLEETTNVKSSLLERQAVMDSHLNSFMSKYYKLKNWALEANKDCEILQTTSADLQKSIAELLEERGKLHAKLEDLSTAHSINLAQTGRMQGLINDIKESAAADSVALTQKSEQLQAQSQVIRNERARCIKLEAHISHMERQKATQDQRFQDERHRTAKCLKEIFRELSRLADQSTESKHERANILDTVRVCETLAQKESTSGLELSEIKTTLESAANIIDSRTSSMIDAMRTELGELGKMMDPHRSVFAAQSLQAIQECNERLAKAQERVVQLEQRAEQSKVITDLLRNGKEVAEDREAYLKSNTAKLIDALTDGNSASQRQMEELRITNSELTARWQSVSSELADCKTQDGEKVARIHLLEEQLDGLRREKESISEQLRASAQELQSCQENAKTYTQEQVSLAEAKSRHVQRDLAEQTQKLEQSEKELRRVTERHSRLQEEYRKCQDAGESAIREQEESRNRETQLQQQLSDARKDTKVLTELRTELALASAKLNELRPIESRHEDALKELASQSQIISQKSRDLDLMTSTNNLLQQQKAALEVEAQARIALVEENGELVGKLNELERKLYDMELLRNRLVEQDICRKESEDALAQARQELATKHKLEEINETLKDKVGTLTREMDAVRGKQRELDSLKAALEEKQQIISRMEKDIESSHDALEELKAVRIEMSLHKDNALRLQEEVSTLMAQKSEAAAAITSNQVTDSPRVIRRAANRSVQSHRMTTTHSHSTIDLRVEDDIDPIQATGLIAAENLSPAQESKIQSANTQYIITETQPEIQETIQAGQDTYLDQSQNLAMLEFLETGDTSSLSDVPDPISDDVLANDDPNQEDIEGSQARGGPHVQANNFRSENSNQLELTRPQTGAERPPSSSYGSVNEQMLLDYTAQVEAGLDPSMFRHRSEFVSSPRTQLGRGKHTSAKSDDDLRQNEGTTPKGGDPITQRAENGTPSVGRQSKAVRGERSETPNHRATTPTAVRERHQPNSAVKRRLEQLEESQPSKRLKRRPANLEVRTPRSSQTSSRAVDKVSPKKNTSYRSVVGTNAPAPGKTAKAAKPARKGSRQDRYSNRFVGDS